MIVVVWVLVVIGLVASTAPKQLDYSSTLSRLQLRM